MQAAHAYEGIGEVNEMEEAVMDGSSTALGIPRAAVELFESARRMMVHASAVSDVNLRYSLAHRAALRTAAGVLAVRATKAAATPRARARQSRPQSAWVLLRRVAPQMGEWADYFATHAPIREAAEAGSSLITARMADDAIRDAAAFLCDAIVVARGSGPIADSSAVTMRAG
ncbi:MAG: hypothetical protein EB027_00730 [Actinobacteria bacterium]|nr:hypothetical protein [Actinomycetota bacterium]